VDDHVLLRNGLAGMLKESGYPVLFEADNGKRIHRKDKDRNGAQYCSA
jgi:DNA-binding NarL/FixJ family response regulator